MPTPDRTTLHDAFAALIATLRDALIADPPAPAQPFRGVHEGQPAATAQPRPFLAVAPEMTRLLGCVDGDKLIELSLRLELVTDITAGDPHETLLPLVGAVDDAFDGLLETGLIDGAAGLDRRAWRFEYPRQTAGARCGAAVATESVVVKVQRGANRLEEGKERER